MSWDVRECFAWRPKCAVGLVFALALPLLSSGCGKKSDASITSAPATPPTVAESNAATSATRVTVFPAKTVTTAGPDLRPLNQALLSWIIQNRRHPANFEDFAASAGIQIPPPPAGKKYIINGHGLISLANQ